MEEPVAVLVDRRPVAVRPDSGEPPPVRFEYRSGSPQIPRHSRPGPLADELADLASHRSTPIVEDVDVLAECRETDRARLGQAHRGHREETRPDLGSPERFTIGSDPFLDVLVEPVGHGPRFQGSPVVTTERSDEEVRDGLP